MCNTTTFKGFLFILSFIGLINYSNAQSGDGDLNTAWSINVNTGPSLLWGDLSDNSDPFSKMFSDERKFSYGILGRKGLNDIFGVNLQAIFGDIKGVRDEWSNGTPTGGFISEVFFTEINANLDVDIINIFNPTERRLINPYLKGGVGLTYFRTDITYKGVEYSSSEQSTLVFPMGGGIRIDLSRRIGITLETTLEYTMTDWFDGYSTDFSEANDWYSYTSIGLTYRFVSKQEQQEPSYDEDPSDDGVIAENNEKEEEVVQPKVPYSVSADMPSEIFQGDTFIVSIKVNKGDANISGGLKLQQTLPKGFSVEEGNSAGGKFEFTNQIVSFYWKNAPEGNQVEVNYTAIATNTDIGEVTIPGTALYTEDSVNKMANFPRNMNIKSFAIKDKMLVTTEESLLIYRVQVQAIYGGKTSAQDIRRRYNISEDVHIDYEGGYTKYTVGGFSTYEEAKAYRDERRRNGLSGAFIVGYYDGSRIKDINQAIVIEKSNKKVVVVAPAATKNTKNDIYRIQIAATSSNKSTYQIKNKYKVNQEVTKTYNGGLYKYTIGRYTNYNEAKKELDKIRRVVPDAFITVTSDRQ